MAFSSVLCLISRTTADPPGQAGLGYIDHPIPHHLGKGWRTSQMRVTVSRDRTGHLSASLVKEGLRGLRWMLTLSMERLMSRAIR